MRERGVIENDIFEAVANGDLNTQFRILAELLLDIRDFAYNLDQTSKNVNNLLAHQKQEGSIDAAIAQRHRGCTSSSTV